MRDIMGMMGKVKEMQAKMEKMQEEIAALEVNGASGGGLVSAGVGGTLTRLLGKRGQHGAITLLAGYDRLGNVVADSTLIRQRGRRDQFSLGLSYGYRFTWK